MEKGLLLGHLTQKPGNVIGTGGGERGQQEWFFLGFGFWVFGKIQHGEKPSWSAGLQDAGAGSRGTAVMASQKGAMASRKGAGEASRPPGLSRSPSPPALPGPARRGPSSRPGRRLPLPSPPPPPPTRRCSCCRRTILHVANGGDAQGTPQVRARGSQSCAGGGAAAGARARAAPTQGARAERRSPRLFCAPKLGMLGFGVPTAPRPSRGALPAFQRTWLLPGPLFIPPQQHGPLCVVGAS